MGQPLGAILADPTSLPVGGQVVQICPPVGGSVLIYNNDLTEIAYVGYRAGLGISNSFPVQPLGSVVVDGSRQLWGFCPTKTVTLTVAPGGTNISPSPAQIQEQIIAAGLATEATQQQVKAGVNNTVTTLGTPAQDGTVAAVPGGIAVTGVPLLALATSVVSHSGTIAAGGTTVVGTDLSTTQISYEVQITAISSNSATVPYFRLTFTWSDSVTGQLVDQESWYLPGGSNGGVGANVFAGTGRVKGDQVTISITNLDTVISGTVTFNLIQTSRVYNREDIHSISYSGIPGVTNANYDPTSNLFAGVATNVGTATPVSRSIPLYAGTVRVEAFTTLGPALFALISPGQAATVSNNTVWNGQITGTGQGFISTQIDLPRAGTVITISNQHTATQQIGFTLIKSEQDI